MLLALVSSVLWSSFPIPLANSFTKNWVWRYSSDVKWGFTVMNRYENHSWIFKSLLLIVGYRGARSPKNGHWEGRDSYGKQHRKVGEKYKKNSNICQTLISGFSKKRVHWCRTDNHQIWLTSKFSLWFQ